MFFVWISREKLNSSTKFQGDELTFKMGKNPFNQPIKAVQGNRKISKFRTPLYHAFVFTNICFLFLLSF